MAEAGFSAYLKEEAIAASVIVEMVGPLRASVAAPDVRAMIAAGL